jgi:F0F1-type ATP synthase assembly protein I
MKKTKTLLQTPSPLTGFTNSTDEVRQENSSLAQFFGAALTMSWQLAMVVLIPVLGGFELDKKLHTQPFLTIVGFLLAFGAVGYVVKRQLQHFSPPTTPAHKGGRS